MQIRLQVRRLARAKIKPYQCRSEASNLIRVPEDMHVHSPYDASLKGEKQTKWLELCGSNRDHQAQTILERSSVSDLLLRDEDEGRSEWAWLDPRHMSTDNLTQITLWICKLKTWDPLGGSPGAPKPHVGNRGSYPRRSQPDHSARGPVSFLIAACRPWGRSNNSAGAITTAMGRARYFSAPHLISC